MLAITRSLVDFIKSLPGSCHPSNFPWLTIYFILKAELNKSTSPIKVVSPLALLSTLYTTCSSNLLALWHMRDGPWNIANRLNVIQRSESIFMQPQNDGKLSNKQKITQCFLSIICYIDTCNVLQGVIHCNAAVLVMVRVVMYRVKETAKGKNLIKFLPLLWPSDRMFVPILMTYEPVKWLFMVYHNKFLKRHTLAKYEEPECAFPTNYEGDMLWSFSIPHKLEGTLVRV